MAEPLSPEEIARLRETIGTWHTPDGTIERLLATLDAADAANVALGKSLGYTLDATRAPRSETQHPAGCCGDPEAHRAPRSDDALRAAAQLAMDRVARWLFDEDDATNDADLTEAHDALRAALAAPVSPEDD